MVQVWREGRQVWEDYRDAQVRILRVMIMIMIMNMMMLMMTRRQVWGKHDDDKLEKQTENERDAHGCSCWGVEGWKLSILLCKHASAERGNLEFGSNTTAKFQIAPQKHPPKFGLKNCSVWVRQHWLWVGDLGGCGVICEIPVKMISPGRATAPRQHKHILPGRDSTDRRTSYWIKDQVCWAIYHYNRKHPKVVLKLFQSDNTFWCLSVIHFRTRKFAAFCCIFACAHRAKSVTNYSDVSSWPPFLFRCLDLRYLETETFWYPPGLTRFSQKVSGKQCFCPKTLVLDQLLMIFF